MPDITAAKEDDADAIATVLRASIRLLCSADHKNDDAIISGWNANKTPQNVSKWLASPGTTLLCARRDGQIAGVGCYSQSGAILLNYVSPAFRFQGISTSLLRFMEDALIATGTTSGTLTSTETALRFHQRNGWLIAGQPKTKFGLPGTPMAKNLV